jgi:DNA-binding HxlR family transcriptional regulator
VRYQLAKPRSYKLLCPIARALDRVGDRWTLLVLRDLHAGPARFSELQRGLTGIAANLLTERLGKLVEDGLISKVDGEHGTVVYELTALGEKTGDLIFDLAVLGGEFKPEIEPVAPGNLRTVATTLGAAAKRVATPGMSFRASLLVDGEAISLIVNAGHVTARYAVCPNPDLVFTTGYSDLLALSEGELAPEVFMQERSQMDVKTPGKETEFLALMSAIVGLLNS